jgi:two-component system sensor histidine kinase CreC
VVQAAIDGLDLLGKSREIDVVSDLSSVPTLLGDPFLLHQAVRNLLHNAIEFSPDRGRVRVELRKRGNDVELEISDGGPGIPDYAESKVFDRFYSLPHANGKRGTGLGLSFVREIMALHGGRVELENAPEGTGCRARLCLHIDRTDV